MASLNKILTPKTKDFEDDDWISISDLMAVLMIVFLFIAIVYMKEVLKEAKEFQLLEDILTYSQKMNTKFYWCKISLVVLHYIYHLKYHN